MNVLVIVLLVLLGICVIPLHVDVRYDNDACITVKVLMLTVFKYSGGEKAKQAKKPDKREAAEEAAPEKNASALKEYFSLFKDILFEMLKQIKKYVVILSVNIDYTFGFSDAAFTGIFSGAAHAVINAFMAGVDHAFKVKNIDININPDFNRQVHDISVRFKIRILAVHILIILFNLVKISLKSIKKQKNKKAVY